MNKFIRNFIALVLSSVVVFGVNISYGQHGQHGQPWYCIGVIDPSDCTGAKCNLLLHRKEGDRLLKSANPAQIEKLLEVPGATTSKVPINLVGVTDVASLKKDDKITLHGKPAVVKEKKEVTIKGKVYYIISTAPIQKTTSAK